MTGVLILWNPQSHAKQKDSQNLVPKVVAIPIKKIRTRKRGWFNMCPSFLTTSRILALSSGKVWNDIIIYIHIYIYIHMLYMLDI